MYGICLELNMAFALNKVISSKVILWYLTGLWGVCVFVLNCTFCSGRSGRCSRATQFTYWTRARFHLKHLHSGCWCMFTVGKNSHACGFTWRCFLLISTAGAQTGTRKDSGPYSVRVDWPVRVGPGRGACWDWLQESPRSSGLTNSCTSELWWTDLCMDRKSEVKELDSTYTWPVGLLGKSVSYCIRSETFASVIHCSVCWRSMPLHELGHWMLSSGKRCYVGWCKTLCESCFVAHLCCIWENKATVVESTIESNWMWRRDDPCALETHTSFKNWSTFKSFRH